jgi:hypothetical protein
MKELQHITVGNAARIPCSIRTLKPFEVFGNVRPWVSYGDTADTILYLASRVELQDEDLRALKDLLERLSSSLKALQDDQDQHPDGKVGTGEQ